MRVKPILLTGAHRSGTTWAGRMFALAPEAAYIHEPLNLNHDPGLFTAQTHYWFTYICKENEADFLPAFQNTLKLQYDLVHRLRVKKSLRGIRSALTEHFSFARYRHEHRVPLLKDPIALFSSEWLASTFDMNVVILIRHPAAIAGSLRAKNWQHPFSHFLSQPLLIRDHLTSFHDEISQYAVHPPDLLDQAALLWKIIYSVVLKFQKDYPNWIFIRHEDLARDPLAQFRNLYDRLGLTFTEHVEKEIASFSTLNGSNTGNDSSLRGLKRDSLSTISNWKSQLTETEIARIKDRVQNVSNHFYGNEEWS